MFSQTRGVVVFSLTTILAMTPIFLFGESPEGVSPGAVDRIAEVEGRCPTFIWDPAPGAVFHELVVYGLSDKTGAEDLTRLDPGEATLMMSVKVGGSAPAWQPEIAECLEPEGKFVWFVRAVFAEGEGEPVEVGEWSTGRVFSISALPSAQEVEQALSVLRRYTAGAGSEI